MTATTTPVTTHPVNTDLDAVTRERLKSAYDDSSAKIQVLQDEAREIQEAVAGDVAAMRRQIQELESQAVALEGSVAQRTEVVATLIAAEQVKLNFLTAKAKELQAAQAAPVKK